MAPAIAPPPDNAIMTLNSKCYTGADEETSSSRAARDVNISLETRIQGLAQELQDLICDFVFRPDSDGDVVVDNDYRPPPQLAVSRAPRRRFANRYYANNFRFLGISNTSVVSWVRSVPRNHIILIKEVRMGEENDSLHGTIIVLLNAQCALYEATSSSLKFGARFLRISDKLRALSPKNGWVGRHTAGLLHDTKMIASNTGN